MHLSKVYRQSIHLNRCFHTSTCVKALSALAQPIAGRISANWKGTSATGWPTKNFIGGEFVESKATEWIDVYDPVSHSLRYVYLPISTLFSFRQPKHSSHESPKPLTRNSKKLSMPHPELSEHGVKRVLLLGRDSSSSTFIPNLQPASLML